MLLITFERLLDCNCCYYTENKKKKLDVFIMKRIKKIRLQLPMSSLSKGLFLLSFSVLIASNLLNTTPYRADLEYVLIPLLICLLFSIFIPRNVHYIGYAYVLIMAFFTLVSTALSDVVHLRTGDIKFYVFILAYLIISSVCLQKKDVTFVINAYAYISLAISCWLIATYLLGMNLSVQHRATLVVFGVSKDQNYTGAFFAPAAIIFFYKFLYSNRKIRSFGYMMIILLAIFFTGSRAALLTCILCIPLAFLYAGKSVGIGKKIVYTILVVIAGISAYILLGTSELFSRMTDMSGYTDNIRLIIWGHALKGFANSPIIGSGLYSASYYSQLYVRWVTHNSFIDIIVGQGLIGIILFLLTFGKIVKDAGHGNRAFIAVIMLSFLLPYFFINGYETLSFWLPMILVKIISDACRLYGKHEILFNDSVGEKHGLKYGFQ